MQRIDFTKLRRLCAYMTVAEISYELGVSTQIYQRWQRWGNPEYKGKNKSELNESSTEKIYTLMALYDIHIDDVSCTI